MLKLVIAWPIVGRGYSCTQDMSTIISNHNKKLLRDNNNNENENMQNCNCRDKSKCPLNGQCLDKSAVYKAVVTANENERHYFGCTATEFKTRFNNHKSSFKNRNKCHDTCLSKHIWELKNENLSHDIKWNLVCHAIPYKCGSCRCDLCLSEKLAILQGDPNVTLNTRSEILSKCRHGNKFKLSNL